MRLFGKPGGTRQQLRGAYVTLPFDGNFPAPIVLTPERTWTPRPRASAFTAGSRGHAWTPRARSGTFVPPSH